MTRTKWIEEMLEKGLEEEKIIEKILKGDAMVGIKPMKDPGALTFAKLNYRKALHKFKNKKQS